MFSFNSQINNIDYKKEYNIQITTDSYDQFKFIQDMARECVDGKHKEIDCSPLSGYYQPKFDVDEKVGK